MAHKALAVAFSMTVAISPLSATPMVAAPAGGPDSKYCMRVEAATGSRIETVQCWTRAEWPTKASMWIMIGPRKASASSRECAGRVPRATAARGQPIPWATVQSRAFVDRPGELRSDSEAGGNAARCR